MIAEVSGQQLALGTAQFGLDYGITNQSGQLDDATVQDLIEECRNLGVSLLDTAGGYGNSEVRLGVAVAGQPRHAWRIITKTPAVRAAQFAPADLEHFRVAWRLSSQRLGADRLQALLVHHADDLLVPGGDALYAWLCDLRASGQVEHIGVSVYDAEQLEALFTRYGDTGRPFDIVQLPASIADQRLLANPLLPFLRRMGVQVHARSLYLQGLLLADAEFVEHKFPGKGEWVKRFHDFCRQQDLTSVQACMSFFRSNASLLDVAVVGVTSVAELRQLKQGLDLAPQLDWQAWAENDPRWVDPRRWGRA
jgi:aryl-alcohol dehydrogenase-like predicted oxidoreductase